MSAELALNAQLSAIQNENSGLISKGLELPESAGKDHAQTPIEARELEEIGIGLPKPEEEREQTHDFIQPYSQPLLKISLIDERLSGDTGGTKPVLELPVSQVVEKPKSGCIARCISGSNS